jgi:hypothetical protein
MSGRVLSVGQCALDHGNISRTLQSAFAAEVESADTAEQALSASRQGNDRLVLVMWTLAHARRGG